ncbi:MAG: glycosyltransferase [Clostridia bacterium]|nr:glycosyltransferase [Clostridia bacterium]
MKVLILSCNTGEGHNSCAKALTELFRKKGITCDVTDSVRFISPVISTLMAKSHVFIYRYLPALFDWGYRLTEKYTFLYRKGSPIYAFFSLGARKLAKYVQEGGYDAVICAHVIPGVMMTEAKPMCDRTILTSFLATDYTCSPIADAGDLDMYFIPDERIRNQFVEKGIDTEKLIPVGIPIRSDFYSHIPKAEAKAAEEIDPEHKHLVVMCGSMGCGPIKKIVRRISGQLHEDMEMTVVCGNNKKLCEKLTALQDGNQKIHIRGYVQNISRLMDSADVYLTKPGGISVTEASVKRIPMVLVNAVGGCERYNYAFFTENGTAKSGKTVDALIGQCLDLLDQPGTREQIRRLYDESVLCNAAEEIPMYLIHAREKTEPYPDAGKADISESRQGEELLYEG